MNFFINKYLLKNPSSLFDLIESVDTDNVIVIGLEGTNGLLMKVDADGNLVWGKSYSIRGEKIAFYRYAKAPNQEYLLLGRFEVAGNRRADHIVMRVTQDGNPIWIKRIHTDKTRNNISIIKSGDNYFLTCWYNTSGLTDKIETHKIDLEGNLLKSAIIDLGGDDQVLSMIPLWVGHIALVGGTSTGNPWQGFLTILNPNLEVVKSSLLSHPDRNSIQDIQSAFLYEHPVAIENRVFLIGRSKSNNYARSFLTVLKPNENGLEIIHSIIFDVTEGHDHNRKILYIPNGSLYVLGQVYGGSYSYVLKFDRSFRIVWAKKFAMEGSYTLMDMRLKNENELWFSGFSKSREGKNDPLVIKTDLELSTCRTEEMNKVPMEEVPMELKEMRTKALPIETSIEKYPIDVNELEIAKSALCPDKVFEIEDSKWIQSPYLYLQSAGSLGHDASKGFLLRWFFLRNLGQTHLPKGDYASNTHLFNKPDDYVCLYRTKYDIKIQQILDFQQEVPIFINDTDKIWVYKVENQVYYLHFKDGQKYALAAASHNPAINLFSFLQAYADGLLELEIRGNLAFSVEANLDTTQPGQIKLETHSVQGDIPLADRAVSSRKIFSLNAGGNVRLVSENIQSVLFQVLSGSLKSLHFEMYSDFLTEKTARSDWASIGRFALSKDTDEVYLRLEDTTRFNVNSHWQKFNDDAFVQVQNYKNRWSKPVEGLAEGVEKYIALSDADPSATVGTSEELDGGVSMDISYFDLLQLAAMDFHIARMLGLGYVDTPANLEPDSYIYLAEYFTQGPLDNTPRPVSRQHVYLTLPTSLNDERLPQKVETLPISYGIDLYNGTTQAFPLTNANGYLPFEPCRYINVRTKIYQDFSDYQGFFHPPTEFLSSDVSSPVFGGVEYRKQGETHWRKPEIAHDQVFKDSGPGQHGETLPLPFPPDTTKPLLIHKEIEEGIHEYAAYSINIFSRASQIHNSVFTDYTKFVKPNTLIPPHNLHVQLIQEESPILLSSSLEQTKLAALTTSDKTLLRLTFLYTHLHDINYGFGNKAEIFFREELPRNVLGGVGSIVDDANDKYSLLSTQAYTYNSTGETIIPNIPIGLLNHFKGGVLILNSQRYTIVDVLQTNANGDFPKLKVKKQEDRNTVDLGNGNLVTTQSFLAPNAAQGDLFTLIENMAHADNWGTHNPLGFSVNIGDSSWTTQVDAYEEDGKTIEHEIRGVWDSVQITSDPINPSFYELVFNNYQLNDHSQFSTTPGSDSVNWYKGIIRIPIQDDTGGTMQKKILDVTRIVNLNSAQNLKLIVHDEAYDSDLGKNIQEGSNIMVNFYPGYRVYLHADASHNFEEATILPQVGEGSKKTLIGLRSVDTTTQDGNGIDYHSSIGIPQIIFAQEIVDPIPPKQPSGPAYATPPDFFGKSTYTFTTEFRAETVAAVFYRADVNAVLKALYKKETFDIIKASLPPTDEDTWFSDRLQDIVLFTNPADIFSTYPSPDDPYTLPKPDNPDYGFKDDANNPPNVADLIKEAVWSVFNPLTEQPLIFSAIKGGDYIPIPKKQTIRDKYGKLLNPSDPLYDLAPMAKKIDGTHKVMFTDFTLDGEMSKNTAYFYFVREMGSRMSLSSPSPILGPIQLVNLNPPESPVVRKVTTQLANALTGANTAINFELNSYSSTDNIKKLQLFRSFQAVEAMTPRTMDMVKEFDLSTLVINNDIIEIQDDFSFDTVPPFGEPLFYKIVALREVTYIDINLSKIIDFVPSKPSKTLLSNIVDVLNPEPPQITKIAGDLINNEIIGLELAWSLTAHNATYYLYKMNSVGNWNKIFEIKSNEVNDLGYLFAHPIPKVNDDGNTIYHRFKVTVENSSGLLNLREEILTI